MSKKRKRCPKCGASVQAIGSHKDRRPCRARQLCTRMREQHGLVPVSLLAWAKVFKWADVPYERFPANAGNKYRRPGAWGHKQGRLVRSSPDLDDPIYEGLSDTLFIEPWVDLLIRGYGVGPHADKQRLQPLVDLLRGVHARDTEFKQAMMTTHILGGDKALNTLLVTEGLWSPLERS